MAMPEEVHEDVLDDVLCVGRGQTEARRRDEVQQVVVLAKGVVGPFVGFRAAWHEELVGHCC